MDCREHILPKGSGCIVLVEVIPGAKESEISGINKWRGSLRIRVAAEAKDDAANRELVRFLSVLLGIREDGVRITAGTKSRRKVLHIDVPQERAAQILRGA